MEKGENLNKSRGTGNQMNRVVMVLMCQGTNGNVVATK